MTDVEENIDLCRKRVTHFSTTYATDPSPAIFKTSGLGKAIKEINSGNSLLPVVILIKYYLEYYKTSKLSIFFYTPY